ncbi:hypothetical protein N9068_00565 [bacterium]|nr:hypothetical protein [bacterium]
MVSRDIWSHGVGSSLKDLLASCCSTLMLADPPAQPAYFSSPWMSNFVLFQNPFCEWAGFFPDLADQPEIRFADFISRLSEARPVRLIVVNNSTSQSFIKDPVISNSKGIDVRLAPETYHEKGILTDEFYLEGSMNLTYSGVFLRDEKIVFHPKPGNEEKINLAYLQFDRFWETLGDNK